MAIPITVRCECGETHKAKLGDVVECSCGRSFDTSKVAESNFPQVREHQAKARLYVRIGAIFVLGAGVAAFVVWDFWAAAITVPLGRPPSRISLWLVGLMFRRLARKRPTLLIRGETSDIITAGIAARMQRSAAAMQRVDVPGVGHAPMLTEPVAVDAIDRFLRTVP